MRIRQSVSGLALLLVVSTISGCKNESIIVKLTSDLTPVIYAYPGLIIKWQRPVELRSDAIVTVTFPNGLCEKSGKFILKRDEPTPCTVRKQDFPNPGIIPLRERHKTYIVTVTSSDGGVDPPYTVDVYASKRCTGFCP